MTLPLTPDPVQSAQIAVIGGGPAGLRAAEVASAAGARVTVFDAKPSVGRKFLVAGRGGLNLTKAEAPERFAAQYRGPDQPRDFWAEQLAEFGPEALREWAAGLGVETFAASTGRVYPREMKAAPLLRRWVERMRAMGVQFALRHRWLGVESRDRLRLEFLHGSERRLVNADAAILALGGASWPETGSDGAWTESLEKHGIAVSPLAPANCGWELPWPASVLAAAEGQPLKNIALHAGSEAVSGELLVTRYGLEGGAIYALGATLRAMPNPRIAIDFKPGSTVAQLVTRLGTAHGNFLAEARKRWRLSDGVFAILAHFLSPEDCASAALLAQAVKNCVLPLRGPRPIAEAISSAGGVRWGELNENLMLRRLPGIFVAGEMIDWEAPTGGYLMQGAFATGGHAARGAVRWCTARNG